MRRRTLGTLALSLCLGLTACGSGSGESKEKTAAKSAETIAPPSARGVEKLGGQSITYQDTQALSATYTQLLRSGDKKGFLATFDPKAKAARTRMGHWFDNLAKLGATEVSMAFVQATRGRDGSGKQNLAADMGLIMQIPGVDPVPLSEWYSFTFAPKGEDGALRVVDVTGAEGDESSGTKYSRYYRQAWDDGPMAVVRGKRVVLVGPAADEAWMRANVGTVDAAVKTQVGRFTRAGVEMPGDATTRSWLVTIQSPQVDDLFDYLGGRVEPTEADFAGFTKAVYKADAITGDLDTTSTVTSRIVIARSGMDSAELPSLVRHEMTHALEQTWRVSSESGRWLTEGLATYLEDADADSRSRRLQAGLDYLRTAKSLPTKDFYEGDDAAVARHYGAGYVAVSYLADRLGDKKLLEATHRLRTSSATVEEAFGMNEDQIAKGALAWAS
jgi:hypothetical protein